MRNCLAFKFLPLLTRRQKTWQFQLHPAVASLAWRKSGERGTPFLCHRAGQGHRITALGSTTKVLLQSCSSYSQYSWLFQYTRLFHAAASLPCSITVSYQSVEVVDPSTDIRRWKPAWEPGSEKQRTLTLPCPWNTATSFQKLDPVVSRTFFDPKLIQDTWAFSSKPRRKMFKPSLFICLESWKEEEMSNPIIQ